MTLQAPKGRCMHCGRDDGVDTMTEALAKSRLHRTATHTVAELELSNAAYREIASKLRAAGYDHAFMSGEIGQTSPLIDMTGIAVSEKPQRQDAINPNHPVTQEVSAQWHKLCVLAMRVLGAEEVVITERDVLMLEAGTTIVCHSKGPMIHLKIVDAEEARRIAKQAGGLPT